MQLGVVVLNKILRAKVSYIWTHTRNSSRTSWMDTLLVKTKLGAIQGHIVSCENGCAVEEYLGIPYAQPPVHKLRFKDPQPLIKLPKDPYQADTYGPSCSQNPDDTFGSFPGSAMWNTTNTTSEDCLYLNLWRPVTPNTLPVMVWIYGGGFYNGCSSLSIYNGATMASHGKVIIVSFNYRTSVFGFLSTGDGKIKGNFGLKDQMLALQWVKENISSFGGDPDNITVFGESAGSASIVYHLLSPYFYKGLFHKAIFQSGAACSRWAYMSQQQAFDRCEEFLKSVGYTENNNNEVLEYLQSLDTRLLLENDWPNSSEVAAYPWVPTVDGDFILNHPQTLLRKGHINPVNCILGCNKDEGSLTGVYFFDHSKDKDSHAMSYEDFIKCEDKFDWDLSQEAKQQVQSFYSKHYIRDCSVVSEDCTQAFSALTGDRDFVWPTLELGRVLRTAGSQAYFYYLTYRASNEVWPTWTGVIHGADLQWIFGLPLQSPEAYTEDELQFSKTIITGFTQFAKTGNPNFPGSEILWPKYNASGEYLEFRGPAQYIQCSKLNNEQYHFWNKIYQDNI